MLLPDDQERYSVYVGAKVVICFEMCKGWVDFFYRGCVFAFSVIWVVGTQRAASYGSLETNGYVFFQPDGWKDAARCVPTMRCNYGDLFWEYMVREGFGLSYVVVKVGLYRIKNRRSIGIWLTAYFCVYYLNELPPRNSLNSDVAGISLSWMGMKYFKNLSRRCASVYSSQYCGTSASIGSACLRNTASSNNNAELNITSAFSW